MKKELATDGARMDTDERQSDLSLLPSVPICAPSVANPALPVPRTPIATRLAEMRDLPFLDDLQKKHSRQLGFFPRAQMEGYVKNQWVLIAEDAATCTPLGYCASRDRYLKRDELGVIYQLCVAPGHQRGLIGATLVKEVFARSAYGCRLYCCWCAQDLEANYFWESLGFVPIAFRAGSTGKRRIHIFWQRRVDRAAGSITTHQSPYWYPFKTDGGAIRADRIVFPIPPGVRWQDVVARASSPCELEKKEKDTGETPVLLPAAPPPSPHSNARPAGSGTRSDPPGSRRYSSETDTSNKSPHPRR